MSTDAATHLSRSYDLSVKVARVFQTRAKLAQERFAERCKTSCAQHGTPLLERPVSPWEAWTAWSRYAVDFAERSVLFWDTLRRRGNDFVEHTRAGLPPVLHFAYEMVLDARRFDRPVNYALVRITPPVGVVTDPKRRPYVIIDPRAGHGPGIGGFKDDSQVGVALAAGHPVYFVIFFPEPEPGQTMLDVCAAEQVFVREVRARHPDSPKPVIVGNCQGGWAAMMLAAADPDDTGPIVINGAPMSYWGGAWREGEGDNPMRYAGGLLGGSWLASLMADLGHGTFDGAWLVQNFENLNPANTFWDKYYHLFANVDSEPPRFLEFERWWGGFYLMNREEIEWITRNLFVGNKLWSGDVHPQQGKAFDLREITSPIILFASMGDNITPPQQAFNWVADVYGSTEEIKARGQVIVGLLHEDIGHLGIFVSGKVARKEHAQIVSVLESIEALPAGLYGMQIRERRSGDGASQYEVQFVERRLEDVVAKLNRFKRADEKPFEAVAAVSEFNQRAYELFAQPLVQATSTEPTAKLTRAFHPLRWQRWAVSDAFNPWLAWLGPAADAIRARRQGAATQAPPPAPATTAALPWLWWLRPVMEVGKAQVPGVPDMTALWRTMAEHNPWMWWLRSQGQAATKQSPSGGDADPARHLEGLVSETTGAALDYYRDVRDAMSEALFFLTYGNLFSFYLADRSPADERAMPAAAADPRDLPFVKEALASLEQGGYPEALARVAALINREGEAIPLARLELRRDLAEEYAEFLPAMPREQMRRIRGEQDIIVRYAPERALATLPTLLSDSADRERVRTLIKRLLDDARIRARNLTADDRARVDCILAVLDGKGRRPAAVPRSA
jgi:pimeloyl-ACP methyl ester carboxylesterase